MIGSPLGARERSPDPQHLKPGDGLEYTSVQADASEDTRLNSGRSLLLRQHRQRSPSTPERWPARAEVKRHKSRPQFLPSPPSFVMKYGTHFFKRNLRRNLSGSNNHCRNVVYQRTRTLYDNPPCTVLRSQPPVAIHRLRAARPF
ncbi:hypothetical protein HPB52_017413 [Rhipicephalus sanguineus]|uniref:Uncharacterized protein n=1 Tax=Rhipicephalus sanguineus TaxID=34632 RepID=A0A9D4SUU0_RHISA|nr:hypothetical protein HPB52_017413 [Rhipicephalus sanguineus]